MTKSTAYTKKLTTLLLKKGLISLKDLLPIEECIQEIILEVTEQAFNKGNALDHGCGFYTFFEEDNTSFEDENE